MSIQRNRGRAVSYPVGLIWGTAYAMVCTVILSAVTAWLIHSEKLVRENTGYCIMAVLLLASYVGSAAAYRKIQRRKLAVSLSAGLAYFLALVIVTALFFGGRYSGVGPTALLILCGSVLSAFGVKKSGTRKGRKAFSGFGNC